MTVDGRGVTNAFVTITGTDGVNRSVITGRNGRYAFERVEAGRTYVVSVRSRRFSYSPKVIEVSDDLSGIDFMPEGPNRNLR